MAAADADRRERIATLLRALNTGTLQALLQDLEAGGSPKELAFKADQMVSGNVDEQAAIAALMGLAETPRLMGLIEGALAQRELQQRRPQIAYSGMAPPVRETVRTSDVFQRLFADARRSIMVTAYSFSDPELRDLLLAAARRGVKVTLYADVPQDNDGRRPAAMSSVEAEKILRRGNGTSTYPGLGELWPTECPNLRVRYDRRLLVGQEFASIHAKCVVVDARWSFITSANLTARGQERNVEVGVLLDDTELADRLLRLFGSLMAKGEFAEVGE